MLAIYLAGFVVCIFSSGFLIGMVVGVKSEEKRAITKIALAEILADEWQYTAMKNQEATQREAELRQYDARLFEEMQRKFQMEHNRANRAEAMAIAMRKARDEAWIALEKRPLPRQRDAKGRFIK